MLLCSISLACARVLTQGLIDPAPDQACDYLQTNGSILQDVSHLPQDLWQPISPHSYIWMNVCL